MQAAQLLSPHGGLVVDPRPRTPRQRTPMLVPPRQRTPMPVRPRPIDVVAIAGDGSCRLIGARKDKCSAPLLACRAVSSDVRSTASLSLLARARGRCLTVSVRQLRASSRDCTLPVLRHPPAHHSSGFVRLSSRARGGEWRRRCSSLGFYSLLVTPPDRCFACLPPCLSFCAV